VIEFSKMHGAGNDFVVVGDMSDSWTVSSDAARRLCDRRTGVGADAVIRIVPRGTGYEMDYRNADGSGSEMCGNGLRVVGKWLGDRGFVSSSVDVLTGSGWRQVTVSRTNGWVDEVTVDMGVPQFQSEGQEPLVCGANEYLLTRVSTGNPHALLYVDTVDGYPLGRVAPEIQGAAEHFPEGVNVEIVERLTPTSAKVRVFERGVGETHACGSGATAVAADLWRHEPSSTTVFVELVGGRLSFEQGHDRHVFMTGPAVEVFSGTIDPEGLLTGS
jgi:diaminopimelate epimerase